MPTEMYLIQVNNSDAPLIRDFRDPPEWPSPFNFYTLRSRDIKKL